MKFVEIADSDDSEEDVATRSISAVELAPSDFAGTIAERAKERSRASKATDSTLAYKSPASGRGSDAAKVSMHNVPESGQHTRTHPITNFAQDDDDELTKLDRSGTINSKKKSEKTKKAKTKSKSDKRKALARYEAPEVEDSTIDSSYLPNESSSMSDLRAAEPRPIMVEPTPGLPTPSSITDLASNKDVLENPDTTTTLSVRDSQVSSLVKRQARSVMPQKTPRQASSVLTETCEDEEDELTIGSENKPAVIKSTSMSASKRARNLVFSDDDEDSRNDLITTKGSQTLIPHHEQIAEVHNTSAPNEQKANSLLRRGVKSAPTSNYIASKTKDDSVSSLRDGHISTDEENEKKPDPMTRGESGASKIKDITNRENLIKQETSQIVEPGKVVNYAANGRSLSLKRTNGPRYRVGLSKRIKVDPLHVNLVRK